jgi:hypothetical protein
MKKYSLITALSAVWTAALLPHLVSADTFDLTNVKVGSNGVTNIVGSAGRSISFKDLGLSVVDDGEAGGKALAFDGKQPKPATINFREPANSLSLKVKIKPVADATATGDQTIFMHPGNFELRYSPASGALNLMVNYKDKTPPVSVKSSLNAGKWNQVAIHVTGTDIKLTVNDTTVAGNLPDGTTLFGAKSFFRIGATGDGKRAFNGLLADITIDEPAGETLAADAPDKVLASQTNSTSATKSDK